MEQKTFAKIVKKAKEDPDFLHRLTFAPEKILDELKKEEVSRSILGGLIAKEPEEVVARTLGIVGYCGNTCSSSCDNTCGQSCGFTTNLVDRIATAVRTPYFVRGINELAWCGNTCTSSCDNTCGQSCGYTTNLVDEFGSQFRFGQSFR